MDATALVTHLESAARDTFGASVEGWTASLRPLDHAEASNDVRMGHLDGAQVFVKHFSRPDRFLNEVHALALAAAAGLRVPDVRLRVDDVNVLVLSRLEGDLLAARWPEMNSAERHRVSRQAGAIAATLNRACPGTAFGARAAPGLVNGDAWSPYIHGSVERWIAAAGALGLPLNWHTVDATITAYLSRESFAARPSLTHPDISPRNLIVATRSEGREDDPPGLIDFELARYDHPGMGFHNAMGVKWLAYEPGLVRSFREGVGSVATPDDMEALDRHSDFFKAMVALSTLAYLAKVGVTPAEQSFRDGQVVILQQALATLASSGS